MDLFACYLIKKGKQDSLRYYEPRFPSHVESLIKGIHSKIQKMILVPH